MKIIKSTFLGSIFGMAEPILNPKCAIYLAIIFLEVIFATESAFCQTVDSFNPNVSGTVVTMAVQPDGKVVFGGGFSIVAGLNRGEIARVNSDGSLDPDFNPQAAGNVYSLAVQPDGKILMSGSFPNVGGQSHTNLARLNPDGSLDTSFNAYASSVVVATALQPDGRILVGGAFTNLAGQSCTRIGRLNSDGSLDTSFSASASGTITAIALQTNGYILVGGSFTNLDGASVTNLGRLNSDGSWDATFNPGPNSTVYAIAVQPDSRILAGGLFTNIAGVARSEIARLNSDGSADSSFNPGAGGRVSSIALEANGKILVAGGFTTLAGVGRNYIGRLNSDGSLDNTFNPGANATVYVIAQQKNGEVLVGGVFTNLAGSIRSGIGRLTNNDAETESIANTSSSVTWMRGGSSPEVWRTTFETSTNGTTWNLLGNGTRFTGGWQLTGVSIPANASLRLTGFSSESGLLAASSQLIQSFWGAPYIVTQPTSSETVLKSNMTLSVIASGTTPLYYAWQINGTNLNNGGKIGGATSATLSVTNVARTNAGIYSVVISNSFGVITSQLASVSVVSAVTNDTFNPNLGITYSTVIQSDNRIIIGGNFSRGIGGFAYNGIGRANYDGSLDSSFRPAEGTIYGSFEQADGRLVIGGSFNTVAGQMQPFLGRLNTDGTYDSTFSTRPNGAVYALQAQPDGKLLVGGTFTSLGSQPENYIGRLNADGSVDTNFNVGASNIVYCMALQTNGQIIVGGNFTNVDGSVHNRIARLNPDGSLDSNFNSTIDNYYTQNPVYCLAIHPDGKILVGGSFVLAEGGLIKPWLLRLNPDGTLDTTFNAVPNNAVYSLSLQTDGKIIVAGAFTLVNGLANNYLARLNCDGTLDATFVASASSTVNSTTIEPDGKILVGGNFGTLYDSTSFGQGRLGTGRFGSTKPAVQSLTYDGYTITWSRTGSCPEVAWVTFDYSTDGVNWTTAGLGARNGTNWQLSSVSLPSPCNLRACGYVASGEYCGSGWFAESVIGPPLFVGQPTGLTNNAGSTATFGVVVSGTGPIAYQWLENGLPLANSAFIHGAQSNILSLASVTGNSIGGYSIVASNSYGCVTSTVALLMVRDPYISSSPVSIATNAGSTVIFSISTLGTSPMSYNWYKGAIRLSDGGNVYGSQTSTLTLSNVLGADAAGYLVAVSNVYGAATSSVASFAVTDPWISSQPSSQLVSTGQVVTLAVGANGTPPINYQWRKQGVNIPNATAQQLTLNNVQFPDGGGYDVVLSDAFGSVTSAVAVVSVNGAQPDSFNPNLVETVNSVAIQPDGKFLIAEMGLFEEDMYLRLNTDGSTDSSFAVYLLPQYYNYVYCQTLLPDDSILIGGIFQSVWNTNRGSIACLTTNGSLDSRFQIGAYNNGVAGSIGSIVLQPDETLVAAGTFNSFDGQSHAHIAKLYGDGGVYGLFRPPIESAATVSSLAIQADGKIIFVGNTDPLSSQPCQSIGRLNPDSTIDTNFNSPISMLGSASCVAVQNDGKILVGGGFASLNGLSLTHLVRLNPDGTVDPSFAPNPNGTVTCLALQTDGKILVGGQFSQVAGQYRNNIARLNPDGTADNSFCPGTDQTVNDIAIQSDGGIVVGGSFATLGGQSRAHLGRLTATGPVFHVLSFSGATVNWQRSGCGPEISYCTFETSTDFTNWAMIGAGTRGLNGWQSPLVSLAANTSIRARGFISTGNAGWFVEDDLTVSSTNPPTILTQDGNFGFSNNTFGFDIAALIGQTVVIETSTNLQQWSPVLTNAVSSSPFYFTDLIQSPAKSRFYRATLF
jgi:uncharacterized delta-60 repeat protein